MAERLERLAGVSEMLRLDFDGKLLVNPAVQADLQLTPAQAAATAEVATLLARVERPSIEEEIADAVLAAERARADIAARREAGKAALARLLTPEQSTRLQQISRQARGLEAFTDPDVAQTLQLTDEQQSTFYHHTRMFMERASDPLDRASDEVQRARKHEALLRALKTLRRDQRQTWQQMNGPPFMNVTLLPR